MASPPYSHHQLRTAGYCCAGFAAGRRRPGLPEGRRAALRRRTYSVSGPLAAPVDVERGPLAATPRFPTAPTRRFSGPGHSTTLIGSSVIRRRFEGIGAWSTRAPSTGPLTGAGPATSPSCSPTSPGQRSRSSSSRSPTRNGPHATTTTPEPECCVRCGTFPHRRARHRGRPAAVPLDALG